MRQSMYAPSLLRRVEALEDRLTPAVVAVGEVVPASGPGTNSSSSNAEIVAVAGNHAYSYTSTFQFSGMTSTTT